VDGLDPEDLYAQNHARGTQKDWEWWEWNAAKGCSLPDAAYVQKFFLRTKQLWDDYRPDMIYFDDSVLPLHGMTDEIGLSWRAFLQFQHPMAWPERGRDERQASRSTAAQGFGL